MQTHTNKHWYTVFVPQVYNICQIYWIILLDHLLQVFSSRRFCTFRDHISTTVTPHHSTLFWRTFVFHLTMEWWCQLQTSQLGEVSLASGQTIYYSAATCLHERNHFGDMEVWCSFDRFAEVILVNLMVGLKELSVARSEKAKAIFGLRNWQVHRSEATVIVVKSSIFNRFLGNKSYIEHLFQTLPRWHIDRPVIGRCKGLKNIEMTEVGRHRFSWGGSEPQWGHVRRLGRHGCKMT